LVIAALKGSFNLWMKTSSMVYNMMQTKVSLERLGRKNERLGLEDDEELVAQDLKSVMLAEVEGKEIDDMLSLDRRAVEKVVEFYEPQLADDKESENEQTEGLQIGDEEKESENEECLEMLSKLNAPEVEQRSDDNVEIVRIIGGLKSPDSGDEVN
jgi:hypothetical protein